MPPAGSEDDISAAEVIGSLMRAFSTAQNSDAVEAAQRQIESRVAARVEQVDELYAQSKRNYYINMLVKNFEDTLNKALFSTQERSLRSTPLPMSKDERNALERMLTKKFPYVCYQAVDCGEAPKGERFYVVVVGW